MPKMITQFAPGEAVEVQMGDSDWRRGTIYKCYSPALFQVNIPGVGYHVKRVNQIRKPEANHDTDSPQAGG